MPTGQTRQCAEKSTFAHSFRANLRAYFNTGDGLANAMADELARRGKRRKPPSADTCLSWMRGNTDPRLRDIAMLLDMMDDVDAERAELARIRRRWAG